MKKEGRSILAKQVTQVEYQYSLIDSSSLASYNYCLGILKKALKAKNSSSYFFYLQLKALYSDSFIAKGFGNKIADHLLISKTSVSLKLALLVKEGFAVKTKTGYYLSSYSAVYEIYGISDHYRQFNTVKIKSKGMLSKKLLKERIEELELISYGCMLKESSLKGGAESSTNLNFQSDYNTIGASMGKSKASCFKIMKRVLRKTKTKKKQNKIILDADLLSDQEKLKIKTYGGQSFYSPRFGYAKQESNSYLFLFKNCRSQKHTLFNASIAKAMQRKFYKSAKSAL